MLGYTSYAGLALCGIFPEDDHSTPDPIWRITSGQDNNLRYLVEMHPYSRTIENDILLLPPPIAALPFGSPIGQVIGGETVLRLSDHHFITDPADTVPNKYYVPLVESPLSYDVSLIRGNDIGVNTPSFGAIEIANGDGSLDYMAQMNFSGRRIVVKAGYDGFKYDEYATVFDGLMNGIEYDDLGIIMTISDKGMLLDRTIITPEYTGTGGVNGNDDLVGQMKPLVFGKCFNVEPVLVDPINLVYQAHAWSMEAVTSVYDSGVALTYDADYPDIALAAPAHGEYATCLATGHIKLGSTPLGRITADVNGDNQDGYVGSVAKICQRMALRLYENLSFSPDDFDTQGWTALDDAISGDVGLYITERATLRQLFDRLLNPYLAYWYFTRFGRLSADLIDTDGAATINITEDMIDTAGVEMFSIMQPAWRIGVAYAPVWTVQKEDELAGAATEAHRTFVGNEHRMVTYEDRNIRNTHSNPIERTFYTNIVDKSEAEVLLERLIRIYGSERRIYRGVGYHGLFRVSVGDVLNVSYPRYGIAGRMVAMGVSEDAKTGKTTLELWG